MKSFKFIACSVRDNIIIISSTNKILKKKSSFFLFHKYVLALRVMRIRVTLTIFESRNVALLSWEMWKVC